MLNQSAVAWFENISGIVIATINKFLETAQRSIAKASPSFTEEFFLKFLLAADAFAAECCEEFATILCRASTRPDIRDTAHSVVARLIRIRCFETLDSKLIEYIQVLERLGTDPRDFSKRLSESRIRDYLKTEGNFDQNKSRKAPPRFKLPPDLKASALLKMLEYLEGLKSLPQETLEFCARKLMAAEVETSILKPYLKTIHSRIETELSNAIATIQGLELVQQKKWEERRAAESAAIKASVLSSAQCFKRGRRGTRSLVFGLVCAVPLWIISQSQPTNTYLVTLAIVSGLTGILFGYVGLSKFIRA